MLLHKYKPEQTEAISRLLFTLQERLVRYNIYNFLIKFRTSFTVAISRV